MLRPTHVSMQSKPQTAVLVVLYDISRSMQLPAAAGNRTRWEDQLATLKQIEPLLSDISENIEIRVQAYDMGLRDSAWQAGRLQLANAAEGTQTDIGTSLHQAVDQELGKRLVGVILLGDGTQTAFQPQYEIFEAARELGSRGYPLYTVAYGPAGDSSQSRDVAVENLPEQYSVFVKNELTVRGLVRVRGYVNQEIPVQLTIEDEGGNRQEIGVVPVQADQDNQQRDVTFTYLPEKAGQYRLTLQVPEQPGELVTKNNRLTAFLTVLDGGLRVLYLEGEPRQEQKFIRWALESAPDVDLDFEWFPSRLRKDWPIDLTDAIEKGHYDAFILGDCDSAALGEKSMAALMAEVERGKGLIATGGYHSFGPGGYRNYAIGRSAADRDGSVFASGIRTTGCRAVARAGPAADVAHARAPGHDARRAGGERTDLAATAPAARCQSLGQDQRGAWRATAGRKPGAGAVAGRRPVRRWPRTGVRRRLDLAMVAAGTERTTSAILATSRALARPT